MEAKELRIGNLIHLDDENPNYVYKIKAIELFTYEHIEDDGIIKVKEFDYNISLGMVIPIPLTEEWLLKFGFEKKEHKWNDGTISDDLFWKDQYCIGIHATEGYNTLGRVHNNSYQFLNNIEHVHQLQNLYFALTGEELEIK